MSKNIVLLRGGYFFENIRNKTDSSKKAWRNKITQQCPPHKVCNPSSPTKKKLLLPQLSNEQIAPTIIIIYLLKQSLTYPAELNGWIVNQQQSIVCLLSRSCEPAITYAHVKLAWKRNFLAEAFTLDHRPVHDEHANR